MANTPKTAALIGALCLLAAPAAAEIGSPRSDILDCAGAPSRAMQVGDVEYLYYPGRVETVTLPAASAHLNAGEACETIVVLRDGRAVGAEWRRSSDLLRAQMCAPRVNRCLN